MYSDASVSGCDAYLDLNREQACHKLWEVSEDEKSSTWRELSAIDYALKSFLPIIKGSHLKWFSDSQTAVRIVQVWRMKTELHDLAIKIFQCCAENQISLDIQLIPRSDLERADYKSRIVDLNDWQINSSCFEYIEKLWGPHTVDCFANYYNKKVETFFSQFWNSNSSGVDFFCTECRKRELFGCSACNHDYEGHPLLVRKSSDWYSHSTFLAIGLFLASYHKKVSGLRYWIWSV